MAAPIASVETRRLAAVLFAALAVAATGALALTQELRSKPDVVNSIRVRATDEGVAGRIRLRLTEHEPRATIAIVARDGTVIAEPISDEPLGPGFVRVRWNGVDETTGKPAAPGRYGARFVLAELDRDASLPGTIRIGEQG